MNEEAKLPVTDFNKLAMDYSIRPVHSSNINIQSEEKFSAVVEGVETVYSMHDYKTMYKVPNLYDAMIYGMLGCRTPVLLAEKFERLLDQHSHEQELRVLEIGAGSGAFGQALLNNNRRLKIIGLDIVEEAQEAAERDRPFVYHDYIIDDLCNLSHESLSAIQAFNPNCVGVASATGWGNHIPVAGFEKAFELLCAGGWFIFHVKPNDPDPECIALNQWIDKKISDEDIVNVQRGKIFHRYGVGGNEIYYDYVIGKKSVAAA